MSKNQDLLDEVQKYLGWKKSKSFVAEKVGISIEELEILIKELKKDDKIEELEESSKRVNEDKGTLESSIEVTFEPKNIDELYKLHKVDKEKYKISSYWSKLKSNGKFTSSIFASLKKPKDYTPEDFAKFLSNWEPKPLEVKYVDKDDYFTPEEVNVEINIADFHLAKKTFQKDNLGSKEFDYNKTLAVLLANVTSNYKIKKLVFPIGNDMFHTDNVQNQTTNGTPQDVTVWYDEEYEKGFDILANAINFLITQAEEVEVILVQGNHDRAKSFYVAHALEVFFKGWKQVKFQRHVSTIKHTVVGNTFIGYHHGDHCKLDSLPILFATSPGSAKAFGNAKYREIHTGDKHHYLAKEITGSGVRVQQVPSLSGHDRWHTENGYVNQIRAGLAFVYHPIHGKIAEFESRL